MSVRIRISYEKEEELVAVLAVLRPVLKSWNRAKDKKGRFFRAYAILDNRKKGF